MWWDCNYVKPKPLVVRTLMRKPKKKRIKEEAEINNLKRISSRGIMMKCANYGWYGHNSRSCKDPHNLSLKSYKNKGKEKQRPNAFVRRDVDI